MTCHHCPQTCSNTFRILRQKRREGSQEPAGGSQAAPLHCMAEPQTFLQPRCPALTWEVHGSYLGSCLIQPAKLVLVVRIPKIVEAGAEDGQAQVAVCVQEAGHFLCTFIAGAPGHIPGDLVLFIRGQHPQHLGVEPVEEAHFSMEVDALGRNGDA